MNGEGDVGDPCLGNILDDHVDEKIRIGDSAENLSSRPRFVFDSRYGDFGLGSLQTDTANDYGFHAHGFFLYEGSGGCCSKLLRTSKTTPNFFANSTERDCITFVPELAISSISS